MLYCIKIRMRCRISSGSQCIHSSMRSKQYNLKRKKRGNPRIAIKSKKSARKTGSLKIQKILILLLLFKDKYGGVPPIFRTPILVHLKEIELYRSIIFGNRCIHVIRSIHHNKFAQRNSRKFKCLVLLI